MAGKRIAGITIEIGGNTTKLEKALAGVNKTISGTQKSLKDVNGLLKLDPKSTELLTQKQNYLKTAIDGTKEKLEKEKAALAQLKANSTTGEVTEEQKALEREIIATQQELQSLTKEYQEFGSVSGQKIQAVGKDIQNAGKKMSEVGQTMTTHVTAPIVAGFTAAVTVAADFDKQMSSVGAITGATGEDMDTLRDKAREMGSKTKFSATEAGEAMEYMGMAGWKTTDIVDGLEGIMNLAAASGEDLGTTADIVTDALTAFGLSAKDSGRFADILAAASTNANTNVSMLGESFKYAAPVAGALGITAEDTSIALGLMANAGIKASQSGTALRTGLSNLAKPTKQVQTYMDKYNIALVENADGSINLRETMISLREKMGNLSESEQAAAASAIFGKNAMAGWLSIINASDEDFEKLTGAIDNCDGTAEGMAATMQDNLSGQLTILKSQLQELAISFGEIAMPAVKKFVEMLQNAVNWFNNLSPATKEAIAKTAALAAAIGPVLLVGGKLVTGIGSVITVGGKLVGLIGAAGSAGGLIGGIGGLVAAAGPLLAGGAVVAGVVAGGVAIYKNWDKIKATAGDVANAVKSKWGEVKQKTAEAFNAAKAKVSEVTENIRSAISTKLSEAAKTAATHFGNIRSWAKDKAAAAIDFAKTSVINLGQKVGSFSVENFVAKAKEMASNAKDKITDKLDAAKTALGNFGSGLANFSFSGFLEKCGGFAKSLGSAVIDKLGGAWEKLKSLKDAFANFQIKFPSIKLPHFSLKFGSINVLGAEISYPTGFDVEWYKKAYKNAMMFTSPTVLQTPYGPKGFGDGHGGEIVLSDKKLREIAGGGATYNVNIYGAEGQNVNALADAVQKRLVALERRREAAGLI